jgi:hypothetical protein
VPIGENVGQAYVRIRADGSGLDDDIRKAFSDEDDAIRAAGDEHGDMYADAYAKAWAKRLKQGDMRDAWKESLGSGRAVDEFIHGGVFREMRSKLRVAYGEAGEVAGKQFEQDLIRGMSFQQLEARFRNVLPEIARATEQIHRMELAAHRDMLNEAYAMNAQYERRSIRVQQWGRMQTAAMAEDRRREIERLRVQTQLITRETQQLAAGSASAMPKEELVRRLAEVQAGFRRLNVENDLWLETLRDTDRELRLLHPRLAATNARITRFSDIIGTSMGRGSRNNLLNFFGSMARGLTNLGGRLITLPAQIAGSMADMRTGFTLARTAGQGFISSIGAAVATGLPGLGTFAATLAGLLITAPLVAGVLSMLAGTITALAGSLAFAAIGLGGGLVALFGPMAAGAVVAASAFLGLSDAQKEALKTDVKPLVNGFKELQEAAREPIFERIGTWARQLRPELEAFEPLFRRIGRSIAGIGDDMVKGLQSPEFDAWRRDITDFLPGAVSRLGDIIRQSLGGVGGIFRGMIPFMEDALRYLDNLTQRFSDWANSAKGQNQIKNFFEDAKQSIKDVGFFAGQAFDLVTTLLGAGKGEGDTLFRDMGDQIKEWVEYLKSPEGKQALQDWIDDAGEFARTLGRVAESAGKLFDVLDSPEARTVGTFLFQSLVVGITTVSTGLELLAWTWRNTIGRITGADPLKGTLFEPFIAGTEAAVEALLNLRNRAIIIASGIAGAIANMAPGGKSPMEGFIEGTQNARDALWNMQNSARSAGPIISGMFDNAAGAVKKYDGLIKSLPRKLVTDIVANGWEHSAAGVKKLIRQYDLTPKQVQTLVKLLGSELSHSQLKKLRDDLVRTGKMEENPRVGMDHKMFDQGKNRVAAGVRDIGGLTGTVHINADTADAMNGISGVTAAMANLPTQKTITIKVTRQMGGEPLTASGGVFVGAQRRIIGEAGPEAVVPLNRPLGQVDPAVRYLSAIAQGLKPPAMANGGVSTGPQKVIDVGGMNIYTVSEDPEAVANQVVNQLVATGY